MSSRKKTDFKIIFIDLLVLGFGILTLIAGIKSIFFGLDIDESYAVTCAYRLVKGDKLLLSMWEPHQFSAIFLYPFLFVYSIFVPSAEGIVIYSRIIGAMLHCLVGIIVLLPFRKKVRWDVLAFVFLIHFNFLPKWIQLPEFELLQYWFFLFSSLFIYLFMTTNNKWFLPAAGLATFCQMMNYPTMVLMVIVYAVVIIFYCRKNKIKTNDAIKNITFFLLGFIIPSAILCICLLTYLKPNQIVDSLLILAGDPSHSRGLGIRMFEYIKEMIPMVIITGLVVAVVLIIDKVKETKFRSILFFVLLLIVSFVHLCILALSDSSQFVFLWRYILLVVVGIFILRKKQYRSKEQDIIMSSFVWTGAASMICALVLTNMTVNVTSSKMFGAVIGILLIYGIEIKDYAPDEEMKLKRYLIKYLIPASALLMLGGTLLFTRGLMNRVTGCIRNIVWSENSRIVAGPAKGIYMMRYLGIPMNVDVATIKEQITPDDKMLYIGNESLLYLVSDEEICAASTLCTATFDESFIEYYDVNPDKYPTVVVIDKMLKEYYWYYYDPEDEILIDWVNDGFETCYEDDYIIILR